MCRVVFHIHLLRRESFSLITLNFSMISVYMALFRQEKVKACCLESKQKSQDTLTFSMFNQTTIFCSFSLTTYGMQETNSFNGRRCKQSFHSECCYIRRKGGVKYINISIMRWNVRLYWNSTTIG